MNKFHLTESIIFPFNILTRSFAYPPFRRKRRSALQRRKLNELIGTAFGAKHMQTRNAKVAKKRRHRTLYRSVRSAYSTYGVGRSSHIIPGFNYDLLHGNIVVNWFKMLADINVSPTDAQVLESSHYVNLAKNFTPIDVIDTKETIKSDVLPEIFYKNRGWTSKSYTGKLLGPPELPDGTVLHDLYSTILYAKRISHYETGGRVNRFHCIVGVGNKNGIAGFALANAPNASAAFIKARNTAALKLRHIPICDNHTIYHNVTGKDHTTVVKMERRTLGFGLRSGRLLRDICMLVGVKDVRAKIIHGNNKKKIIACAFNILESQQTHQKLADFTRLCVVEFRREKGYYPILKACPIKKNISKSSAHVHKLYGQIQHNIKGYLPYSM